MVLAGKGKPIGNFLADIKIWEQCGKLQKKESFSFPLLKYQNLGGTYWGWLTVVFRTDSCLTHCGLDLRNSLPQDVAIGTSLDLFKRGKINSYHQLWDRLTWQDVHLQWHTLQWMGAFRSCWESCRDFGWKQNAGLGGLIQQPSCNCFRWVWRLKEMFPCPMDVGFLEKCELRKLGTRQRMWS